MRTLMSLFLAATLSSSALAAEAKDFTLPSIENQKVSLSQFGDEVVLLSFWATWCGPCKEEMPHLQKIYDAHHEQGFTVISISTDDARSASRVKPFIKKNKYSFPVLLDKESKVIQQYNPSKTLPYTVIIHKGEVIETHSGYNPGDEEYLEEVVAKLLSGASAEKEAPEVDPEKK